MYSSHSIHILIRRFIFVDCDPPATSSDVSCAIVGSSVVLTVQEGGDEITDQERAELRALVIKALSDAVKDGSFEDHLP